MRDRRIALLVALLLALALVLAAAVILDRGGEETPDSGQALLDAMYDRIGVTQWAEAIGWLAYQENPAVQATPVWTARHAGHYFHSVPLCGGLKSPVETTLEDALARGLLACPVCWEVD